MMKNLIKLLFFITFCTPTLANSKECSKFIIAFRGLNDSFNYTAFNRYVAHKKACAKVFSFHEINSATQFVNKLTKPYEVYGFSAGALSIRPVLRAAIRKPVMIITIGAYNTSDVMLDEFGIDYKNYFDLSSIGSKRFGTFIEVSHFEVEKYAVEHLINSK